MFSIHDNFNIFQGVEKVLGKRGAFISERTRDRNKFLKWIKIAPVKQLFYQFLKSWDMARELSKTRNIDFIFIYEHKPQYSLVLYLTCIFKRVPCFFFVHGAQQTQSRSLFHKAGFKMIYFLESRFNFWPIHIELSDDILEPQLRFKKSLMTLHPLPRNLDVRPRRFNPSKVTIGIVGMLRGDKPIKPLLDCLETIVNKHPNYQLIVGTPFWALKDELKNSNVRLEDTTGIEKYLGVLNSIDIIVTNFEKSSFYFRPSGIINDALAAGCYVIAPDFPVFKAQMSFPSKVGGFYESFEQIEKCIEIAVAELFSNTIDFETWRTCRSNDNLVNALAGKMKNIIDRSR